MSNKLSEAPRRIRKVRELLSALDEHPDRVVGEQIVSEILHRLTDVVHELCNRAQERGDLVDTEALVRGGIRSG